MPESRTIAAGVCGTCKHWTERKVGFGCCAMLPVWRWFPESSPCQFKPVRWLAIK